MCTGVDHTSRTRSTYHVSDAFIVSAGDALVGRHEEKYRREPSGENPGSRSRYSPEKGNGAGADQRASASVDVINTMRGGVNRVNTTVFPSGVNVDANTSPVEITPGAKILAGSPARGASAACPD